MSPCKWVLAPRLLFKGFKISSCFGIKALCGGFLQTAMDPAREKDGLSEREKREIEAMKRGGGESETRRWPKDPWSDVTEQELKERNKKNRRIPFETRAPSVVTTAAL
jgi:hypothetical protein